jgi:ubiquinone/menaquinone biosynthesis C-methylase UbiE/dienelactone hydrolase
MAVPDLVLATEESDAPVNGTKSESTGSAVRWKVLAVDAKSARLDALRAIMEGKVEFYSARGLPEAFYWADKLVSLDALILHHPAALSSRPQDLLQALHATLKDADRIVKVLVVDPKDEAELLASPLLTAGDFVLTNGITPAELWKEVRRRLARRDREKRASLRVRLPEKPEVRVDVGSPTPAVLGDLSETGMFLKNAVALAVGQSRPFVIHLSDLERFKVEGIVVRADAGEGGVGVAFRVIDETTRRLIFERLAEAVSSQDLRSLKERYPFLRTEEMVPFEEPAKIEELLRDALGSGVEIMALLAQGSVRAPLTLERIETGALCVFRGQELDVKFKTSDPIFLSYQLGYATYNFETTVRRIAPDGLSLECFYPRVMFYSEKRSAQREVPTEGLVLEISLPAPYGTKIRGAVTDISENGASFVFPPAPLALLKGTPLETIRILDGDRIVREGRGEIRYSAKAENGSEGTMKAGIQFGIGRTNIESIRVTTMEAAPQETAPRAAKNRAQGQDDFERRFLQAPDVVRFRNAQGEEIVGLLNAALPFDSRPVPVVLIPPAFGKTKETLFSLALTLAVNFYRNGQPLAVLRFDGIRRKGESAKDPEASEPPYEMLNATYSQGSEDIATALDWIRDNPRFTADRVILVTFSLAALEARLALRNPEVLKRIAYWIPCMGTPEIRQLMTRINCGLDLLEQHQLGINVGAVPILGNLVNIDRFAADGIRNRLTTLDYARDDMRRIAIPVTWILGEHDHWVDPDFVRDIMGIEAGAPREVMTIPLGHNARTSDEALRMFGTIAALAYRFLHKDAIQPTIPSKDLLDHVRRSEKDRLPARRLPDRKDYWKRYLTGEEQCIGFDVFTLTDEYQQLMQDQLEALDPRPGESILDLGGGTGNFVDHLLRSGRPLPARVTIADLVPEAVRKALTKLASPLAARDAAGLVNAVVCDVEMNRYAPLRRFLAGEIATFRDLADRVEGLALESAEKIQAGYSPRLHRILRGEPLTAERESWIRGRFGHDEYRIIRDVNAAARQILGLKKGIPAYEAIKLPGGPTANLNLPLHDASFDKILMSLVLSYIFDPFETLIELRRLMRPGGRLVLSSMVPDADASGIFTRLADKVERLPDDALPAEWPKRILLKSMRSFLNDAQALVELAEAGTFDFFDPEKLTEILDEAGWDCLGVIPTFGTPPQGYVAVARARENHG